MCLFGRSFLSDLFLCKQERRKLSVSLVLLIAIHTREAITLRRGDHLSPPLEFTFPLYCCLIRLSRRRDYKFISKQAEGGSTLEGFND